MGIEDLNPVTIRVLNEGQSLHAAVIGLLNELDAKLLETVGWGRWIFMRIQLPGRISYRWQAA